MEAPVSARGLPRLSRQDEQLRVGRRRVEFRRESHGQAATPSACRAMRVSGDWFHVLGVDAAARSRDPARRRRAGTRARRRPQPTVFGRASSRASPSAVGNDDRAERRVVSDHRRHAGRASAASTRATADLFVPLALAPAAFTRGYTNEYLNSIARLKAAYHARARAGGDEAVRREPEESESEQLLADVDAQGSQRSTISSTGRIRPALLVLLGAVGFRAADRVRERRQPAARARRGSHRRRSRFAPRSAPTARRSCGNCSRRA